MSRGNNTYTHSLLSPYKFIYSSHAFFITYINVCNVCQYNNSPFFMIMTSQLFVFFSCFVSKITPESYLFKKNYFLNVLEL